MRPVQHTIRLPVSLDTTVRLLAQRHDMSVYAMLQRSVQVGITTLGRPAAPDINREIIAELASVSTHIVHVERMLDRALFTTCAAYCYARHAAMGLRKSDEAITDEIRAAYDRQRRLSQEGRS